MRSVYLAGIIIAAFVCDVHSAATADDQSESARPVTDFSIPRHIHKLPLLPEGQHLGYIEGFNPDDPPRLRKVMDEAFEESLKNGMKVARIQMDWPDVEPTRGSYEQEELLERLQFYHSRGLAIYLLLCTADTEDLNYPTDLLSQDGNKLARNMKPDDPLIVTRYKKMLNWVIPIAKKHGVYCISVGNEPDTHHEDDPSFMPHFIKFVAAVRDHAHTIDPDIAITYTSTCDPVLRPDRTYGKEIASAVDIVCFNFYGLGNRRGGLDLEATETAFNGMRALSRDKPLQIQELGCSSICNPDKNWQFHPSSPEIQRQFFEWAFKRIQSTKQIRAAFVFQLVENSPYIDKFYRDTLGAEMPGEWTKGLCDWLKGLGLISTSTARKKPAWNEFLNGLRMINANNVAGNNGTGNQSSRTGEVEITILHTNDFHQHLEPLPRIAGYVAQYKREHANTVFVDAGDWFDRGSSLVPLTRGEAIYGAMARMDYDMWIVGNHDWAYGGRRLVDLMKQYPVPVLATNLATTKPPLPPNVVRTIVKEFDGVRMGFFGITLDTYGKNPKARPDLYVLDCRVETAKAVADLKRSDVDIIVAVTHLGFKKMPHEVGRSSHPSDQDLAAAYPDIDVIIGGHSHTRLQEQTIRDIHQQTGVIVTQAGALGEYVGRLTLRVDAEDRTIKDFDVETIPVTDALPEQVQVASFLKQQYAQHMPNAKVVVGEFKEPMQLYNMAFWYADFIRRQANADICLLPRKTLYDERDSFAAGKVDVERLLGCLYDRYVIKSTVKGSDLLKFCDTDDMRDRFNPFHHRGRPFSGDAMFLSGFEVTFEPATTRVKFSIEPEKLYTLAIPWPFTRGDIGRYRHQLPPRRVVERANPAAGLSLKNSRVLPSTTRELLVREGIAGGLDFYVKFPQPLKNWGPWTKHFETKLSSNTLMRSH